MELQRAIGEIEKFSVQAKRMQQFLIRFIEYIQVMQKKYEENNQKSASLNKFLYEYELHSVLTYSPKVNTYLGNPENLPNKKELPEEQLLFENSKNMSLRKDFDSLCDNLTNPFTDIKMWLKYELLEIVGIHEAIEKRNEL